MRRPCFQRSPAQPLPIPPYAGMPAPCLAEPPRGLSLLSTYLLPAAPARPPPPFRTATITTCSRYCFLLPPHFVPQGISQQDADLTAALSSPDTVATYFVPTDAALQGLLGGLAGRRRSLLQDDGDIGLPTYFEVIGVVGRREGPGSGVTPLGCEAVTIGAGAVLAGAAAAATVVGAVLYHRVPPRAGHAAALPYSPPFNLLHVRHGMPTFGFVTQPSCCCWCCSRCCRARCPCRLLALTCPSAAPSCPPTSSMARWWPWEVGLQQPPP